MENINFLRFFMAFILVISLMGGLWLILKKLGLQRGLQLPTGKIRRLSVVEILPIDIRHKAVLLRLDNKEHLVILGPNGETVVQNAIPVMDEKNAV